MSATIIRRVVSRSSDRSKIRYGASALVGRPSLLLPPYFYWLREWVRYRFYSPLAEELVRFTNRGGEKEVALMKDKRANWVGSSHGWLVLFNYGDSRATNDMCLLNPLSGRRINLPPFRGDPFPEKEECRYPFKVILSHPPAEEQCRAVMILGSRDRAAFCSPGRSDKWSPLGRWNQPRPLESWYNDFVYSASRNTLLSAMRVSSSSLFTGSLISDDLEFWDAGSTMEAPVGTVRAPRYTLSDPGYIWQTYLVSEEESGQLFMVRRFLIDNKRVDYKVYSIGDDHVVQLRESLDDLVMFIGMNHSIAVKASRFPEYKANHIYFSGVWYHANQFADVYDYDNKGYSQLIDLSPDQKFPHTSTLPWFTLTNEY